MKRSMLVLLVVGCTHVPVELTEARKNYVNAQPGADLSAARVALDAATKEFETNGDTERTRELAYIAQRRVDVANSKMRLANDQAYLAGLTAEAKQIKEERQRRKAEIVEQAAALPPVPKVTEVIAVPTETPPVPSPDTEPVPELPSLSPALESLSFAKVSAEAGATVITVPASLLFDAGKPKLSEEARARLDEIARGLKDQSGKISIEVHTDATGLQTANQQLSAKRALAVMEYLIKKGVPKEKLEAHGLGDTKPVVENDSAENRATNRRLEIVVKPVPVS